RRNLQGGHLSLGAGGVRKHNGVRRESGGAVQHPVAGTHARHVHQGVPAAALQPLDAKQRHARMEKQRRPKIRYQPEAARARHERAVRAVPAEKLLKRPPAARHKDRPQFVGKALRQRRRFAIGPLRCGYDHDITLLNILSNSYRLKLTTIGRPCGHVYGCLQEARRSRSRCPASAERAELALTAALQAHRIAAFSRNFARSTSRSATTHSAISRTRASSSPSGNQWGTDRTMN